MIRFIYTALFSLLLNTFHLSAQPFINEIKAFKKADSVSFPPKKAILFVGSSSFRLWENIQGDFPAYNIINRGFGGSSLPDLIRYENDVIFPYDPSQIVIYCGENDFTTSDTVTGKIVFERFQQLFSDIREKYPKVHIAYVSIKPSPSRAKYRKEIEEANESIRLFLKKKKKTVYIDIYNAMLRPDGSYMTELFLADQLHMNRSGYVIWQKQIEPHLVKK